MTPIIHNLLIFSCIRIKSWALVTPKMLVEKKHNKDVEALFKTEQAQRYPDLISGNGPKTKRLLAHINFLDYFKEWVTNNAREGNRHAQGCLSIFTEFARYSNELL